MLSCKQATMKMSESLDRQLPFGERFGLAVHLMMCGHCRRALGQFRLIHHFAGNMETTDPPSDLDYEKKLSDDAREKIKTAIEKSPR